MSEESGATEVAVLGGGPGGYAAAFRAADLGKRVALIDEGENPGGVCLYRGCIPSKALLHVAKVIAESREAAAWGVEFSPPKIDLNRMRAWKEDIVTKLTAGVGQLSKARGVRFVRGRGKFLDAGTLRVERSAGGEEDIPFERAIIAAGSRPFIPPGLSLESARLMDSTSALALKDAPESLLVVGGGYIGLELGSVYAALGARVTVVEMTAGLLPGADRDLVNILAKRLEKTLHAVLLNTKVAGMKEVKGGIQARLEGEGAAPAEAVFEKVLVAVGRAPNSGGLGLENTKVEIDEKGFIKTDAQRRTAEDNIFAIGDVAGEPMLAHKATHEGRVAAEAIAGAKAAFEPAAIPAVVFTDPEIAWCGLTETAAKVEKIPVQVARFPWAASGRAQTLGQSDGVTKLVIDPETERVLGVGICGSGAGELIAEGVLAVEMAAVAADVGLSIHPHPTLSETLMESADVFFGTSTHIYRPKRG